MIHSNTRILSIDANKLISSFQDDQEEHLWGSCCSEVLWRKAVPITESLGTILRKNCLRVFSSKFGVLKQTISLQIFYRLSSANFTWSTLNTLSQIKWLVPTCKLSKNKTLELKEKWSSTIQDHFCQVLQLKN